MKRFLYSLVACALLTGCSQKQYFEPEDTQTNDELLVYSVSSDVSSYNNKGVTYEDFTFASDEGIHDIYLEEGYRFLNDVNGAILSSDKNGNINIDENDERYSFHFDKNIISASKKGDFLVMGFTDNSFIVYDVVNDTVKYKEYFEESVLNDVKISNPIFLETVVMIPTLNGKVAVVDIKNFELIRTLNIDPNSQINNIIYFSTSANTMIATTPKKLFVFDGKNVFTKDIDVKQIVTSRDKIYVTTLDGEIRMYNFNLEEQSKQKFKFAKFLALAAGTTNIYAVESQDYIIEFDRDLRTYIVYDFASLDETEKVTAIDDTIYFENKYIQLP